MEAVGLAVGVTSLVGLFTTLLEIQVMVDSYRDSGSDARYLTILFEAEKLKLEQWFSAVGLDASRQVLAPNHHPALDNPQILAFVDEVLRYLREQLPWEGQPSALGATAKVAKTKHKMMMLTRRRTGNDKIEPGQQLDVSSPVADGSSVMESKTQKLRWIFRDKAKAEARAAKFANLVEILRNFVSPDGPSTDADAARAKLALDLRIVRDVLLKMREESKGSALKDVVTWLNVDNSSVDKFESSCRTRLEGTCDWILETRHFLEWSAYKDGDAPGTRVLWIHGPAGFGKSTLCSRIIQHLSSSPTKETPLPLAYHFYSGRFSKTEGPMFAMRSWLSQLVQRHAEKVLDIVRGECASDSKTSAALSTIISALKDAILTLGPCLLVMDGLDESLSDVSNGSSTSLLDDLFTALRDLLFETRCRILILSRDEPEIQTAFQEMLPEAARYRIRPSDTEADTAALAQQIVQRKLAKKTAEVQDEVSAKMSRLCAGQFLWLKLQRENLRAGANRHRLLKDLDRSPLGLDQTYSSYWDRIQAHNEEDRDKTLAMLRWITFSLTPLTVGQLVGAVLVRDRDGGSEEGLCLDDLPDAIDEDFLHTEILGRCTLLVEARAAMKEDRENDETTSEEDEDGENDDKTNKEATDEEVDEEGERNVAKWTIHLTHFSVKQFLTRKFAGETGVDETGQHVHLARLCLRYVAAEEVWEGDCSLKAITDPFLAYAADGWVDHVAPGQDQVSEKQVMDLSEVLFDPVGSVWGHWSRYIFSGLFDRNCDIHQPENERKRNTPLSLASHFGLLAHAEKILAEDDGSTDINSCVSTGWNALHTACVMAHGQVVELLLRSGADVMHRDCCGAPALHYAVTCGDDTLIRLLLDKGADIDATDIFGTTALFHAAASGQASATKVLLDLGADSSIPRLSTEWWEGQWTPFFAAVRRGHISVVKTFLDHHPALHVATRKDAEVGDMTILATACWYREFDLARYLLRNYTQQVAAHLCTDKTSLLEAVRENDPDMVETLLQHGADPLKNPDNCFTGPLDWAVTFGLTEVVRRLVRHTRPKVQGARSWLDMAHEGDTGENSLEDGTVWGSSPLMCACLNKEEQVVELLLEAGSDHSLRNSLGKTALMLAAMVGTTRAVQLLVAQGADIECKDKWGYSALYHACCGGQTEAAKILVDLGADVEAEDNMGNTPLMSAVMRGHTGLVQMLLAGASAVDKINGTGESALHEASEGAHYDAAKLQLDESATNSNIAVSEGEITSNSVSKTGFNQDGRKQASLIEKPNGDGFSALHLACFFAKIDTVKLLLDAGADVDLPDAECSTTPVMHALDSDNAEGLIRLLLDRGADLSKRDDYGKTALHHAASGSRVDAVRLIAASLGKTSSEEAPGGLMLSLTGRSSLVYAVLAGREANAEVLLEMRPHEEHVADLFGNSVMDLAIRMGRVSMVERLILKGGHRIKASSLGRTTHEWAHLSGSRAMVRLVDAFLQGPDSKQEGEVAEEELAHDPWSEWSSSLPSTGCIICCIPFKSTAAHRECETCREGKRYTCEACFSRGYRCMDDTHEMRLVTEKVADTVNKDQTGEEHEGKGIQEENET